MTVKVLMSGPIRPTSADVLHNIELLRSQLSDCKVYLLTWRGQLTDEIRSHVDHAFEITEPSDSFVYGHVTARTIQQQQLGDQLESWTTSIYKMIHGVRMLCELVDCDDEDVVIRIRTDSIFSFKPGHLQHLVDTVGNTYTARNRKTSGCGVDDWFVITRFKHLRNVWTILDYNQTISSSWNAEGIIHSQIQTHAIPIRFFDTSVVDCYILRPNGFKHYYD
jgi:hypothetical protein